MSEQVNQAPPKPAERQIMPPRPNPQQIEQAMEVVKRLSAGNQEDPVTVRLKPFVKRCELISVELDRTHASLRSCLAQPTSSMYSEVEAHFKELKEAFGIAMNDYTQALKRCLESAQEKKSA